LDTTASTCYRPLVWILTGATVVACAGTRSRSLTTAQVDTLPGNIIRVRNTGPTGWTDTNGWKLVLERSIHPPPGDPGELGHPAVVVATSGGDVLVLDSKPAVIKHYSADGTFLNTIGREGSGPGEFHDYGGLYVARDTLLHQDAEQTRASVYGIDGKFITSWTSAPMTERGLVADDSGRVPILAETETNRINSGHAVIRHHTDGSTIDTVWYPDAQEPATWRLKTAHADMGMLVPYAPDRLTAFDRAGRLVWGDQRTYRLLYSRTGLDTVVIVEAVATPVQIADSIRRSELASALTHSGWLRGIAKLDDIPRDYPVWTAAIADGANNLWVLRPGPRGDGDHWDVFTAEGRLLGAVPAPFNHVDGTFWTRERVYVIEDAADGTPAIQVFRIARGIH
jgi:hypothetical protein